MTAAAFDETYVAEILDAARDRRPADRQEFRAMCLIDLKAGYAAEVDEAERRFFAPEARP